MLLHTPIQDPVTVTATNGSSSTSTATDAAPDSGPAPLEPPAVLQYTEPSASQRFWTSVRLAFALPWRRFKKGSVLTFKVGARRHAAALLALLH
jgi:hypothetical protein